MGKYDVMEAEVGPRGTLENDMIYDFWGDDAGNDRVREGFYTPATLFLRSTRFPLKHELIGVGWILLQQYALPRCR